MLNFWSILLFLYITLRLWLPLPVKWYVKLVPTAFTLLIALKHFILRKYFGGLAFPELSVTAQLIIGWLYAAFIFLFLLVLFRDILIGILWLSRLLGSSLRLSVSKIQWAVGLSAVALFMAAYGVWEAVRVPDIRTTAVTLSKLPKELDGITVVQISDLHASDLLSEARVDAIVAQVNALHPDLILLTGDIVDGSPGRRVNDVAPLRNLKARYGVFACVGNHEYYSGYAEWINEFSRLGLLVLENSHVVVEINNYPVVIAGVTDPAAGRRLGNTPDIRKALSGAPTDAPVILMAHQPRDAKRNAAAGVDLQLSGHTHGGQFIGLGHIVGMFNEGFLSDWYQVEKMHLYVSRGAGLWNGFPVRMGVPGEVTEIVLHSEKP